MYCGAENDYTTGPYSVTISTGMTTTPYNIVVTDDNLLENSETFAILLNPISLPSGVIVGDINQATVTIINDDGEQRCYYIERFLQVKIIRMINLYQPSVLRKTYFVIIYLFPTMSIK